ncbi:hypothetical protein [Streptomyces nanshensis]|uniref:Uncharacterized protein n=1 Tax=Streptomyces nanshensis TaxID=518642 RepID=A0A1E7LC49_9ACTN|nr:hypothetical protein [Streptomyces nanshensis]OEV13799.1 hypothetical protein AN218_01830 [Streptomyces nanshensis]
MSAPFESEQARLLAEQVQLLIDQFTTEQPKADQKTLDYLTLMHTELLEFADNPGDLRLRVEVEKHMRNFLALAGQPER